MKPPQWSFSAGCEAVPPLQSSALRRAVTPDEVVGRAVVLERGILLVFEFGDDLLRELLAEFYAPLVEGVDVPDDALHEDTVLVKSDQFAQDVGRELAGEDHVRRAVALEYAMRNEPVGR